MADYTRFAKQHLPVEVKDKVAVVTLNRPERLNAIGDGMHEGLEELLQLFNTDPDVGAIVLTGAGRAFCSGGDLKDMAGRGAGTQEQRPLGGVLRGPKSLFQHFLTLEPPIIAAINGDAAGLGATLALMCDVTFMSEKARIGDTHVRAGLVAGDGGALIWPQLVGPHKAKEMLMSGRLLTAAEADKLGLVNHVVPADKVMAEALGFARELAHGPTMAIKWTKMAVNRQIWNALNTVMDFSLAVENMSFLTQDHAEAAKAFVEKRAPKFQGK